MADLRDVDAFVLGVLLAFAVVRVCLTPYKVGDAAALFKRPPLGTSPPKSERNV